MVRRRADRSATAPMVQPSALPTDTSAVPAMPASSATAPARHPAALLRGQCSEVGAQQHRLVSAGGRRAGSSAQLGGQGRTDKGSVGQAAAELLGDERDLDRRGPGRSVVCRRPQLAPPGGGHGGVELRGALPVVELGHAVDTQAIDHLRRRLAQRDLFGREADVHQSGGAVARAGAHSSRRVRRNTLPDGVLGMASTTTTWRSRL